MELISVLWPLEQPEPGWQHPLPGAILPLGISSLMRPLLIPFGPPLRASYPSAEGRKAAASAFVCTAVQSSLLMAGRQQC